MDRCEMIISGIFTIDELKDEDAGGFERAAIAHNQMDESMSFELFLAPYIRPSQCKIKVGSKVFAFVDTVSGLGVALFGFEDADVDYSNRAEYHYTKTLTVDGAVTMKDKLDVTKDITSASGDVVATTISLKGHTHPITAAKFNGVINPQTGVATGTISGNTEAPV